MAATGGVPAVKIGEISRIISSANSMLRGYEANKALNPYSLDNALQEQVDRLKGTSSDTGDPSSVDVKYSTSKTKGTRMNKYDRLLAVQTDLQNVIDAVKKAGDDPAKLSELGLGG